MQDISSLQVNFIIAFLLYILLVDYVENLAVFSTVLTFPIWEKLRIKLPRLNLLQRIK
jgi:hypothetical protein